jgi:hypothetical protein
MPLWRTSQQVKESRRFRILVGQRQETVLSRLGKTTAQHHCCLKSATWEAAASQPTEILAGTKACSRGDELLLLLHAYSTKSPTWTDTKVRHGKHNGWPFADLSSRDAEPWAATCHQKLNGTFLLLTGNGISLTTLGLFSFSRLLLSFFCTRRLSDSYPFCGYFLYGRSSSLCQYTVYYGGHMNISALNARVSTFFR